MIDLDPSSFCTMADAASYLGYHDAETLDDRLIESEKPEAGKIRYRVIATPGAKRRTLRLWKADVLALLRPFDREEQAA